MLVCVKISDPVMRDSIRWVVMVGLPTIDLRMRVVWGWDERMEEKKGKRGR